MKHKFTRIYKLKAELKLKTKDYRRKDFLRALGKRDSNVYQVTQVSVVCFLYHSAVTEIYIYLFYIYYAFIYEQPLFSLFTYLLLTESNVNWLLCFSVYWYYKNWSSEVKLGQLGSIWEVGRSLASVSGRILVSQGESR